MIYKYRKRVNQQTVVSTLQLAEITLLLVLNRLENAGFLAFEDCQSGVEKVSKANKKPLCEYLIYSIEKSFGDRIMMLQD